MKKAVVRSFLKKFNYLSSFVYNYMAQANFFKIKILMHMFIICK